MKKWNATAQTQNKRSLKFNLKGTEMNIEFEIEFRKVTYVKKTIFAISREDAIDLAWESLESEDGDFDLESVKNLGTEHNYTDEDL